MNDCVDVQFMVFRFHSFVLASRDLCKAASVDVDHMLGDFIDRGGTRVSPYFTVADSNGQLGGAISRIALGTASYRTFENRCGSPSRLTGIASSVQTSAQGVCQ